MYVSYLISLWVLIWKRQVEVLGPPVRHPWSWTDNGVWQAPASKTPWPTNTLAWAIWQEPARFQWEIEPNAAGTPPANAAAATWTRSPPKSSRSDSNECKSNVWSAVDSARQSFEFFLIVESIFKIQPNKKISNLNNFNLDKCKRAQSWCRWVK